MYFDIRVRSVKRSPRLSLQKVASSQLRNDSDVQAMASSAGMKGMSKPILEVLPAELVLQVISFCEKKVQAKFARLSKEFHALATPELYKVVELTAYEEGSRNSFRRALQSIKKGRYEVFIRCLEVDIKVSEWHMEVEDETHVPQFVGLVCDLRRFLHGPVALTSLTGKSPIL